MLNWKIERIKDVKFYYGWRNVRNGDAGQTEHSRPI